MIGRRRAYWTRRLVSSRVGRNAARPGYVIGVEALFGAADERLSIGHDAGSGAGPYIQGTLLAIRKVRGRVGLLRGLDRIMD